MQLPWMPPRRAAGTPLSEQSGAIRAAVMRNLERAVAEQIVWSRSMVPTIQNTEILRKSCLFAGPRRQRLLNDLSVRSVLEEGPRAAAAFFSQLDARGPRPGPSQTLTDMASAFQRHVLPMALQQSTRVQQWLHWRAVLTLAIAHECVDQLVPMPKRTLMALTWQLLTLGCGPGHVQAAWGAISQRHRALEATAPLAMRGEYSAWSKAINNIAGRPRSLKFPIRKELIWKMLSMPDLRRAAFVTQRNILATVLATLCCARVSEIASLQACDILFDFDSARGSRAYAGTAAVRISKRKNDTLRKGLFPRLGKAINPTFDVVDWIKQYQQRFGLAKHPTCHRPATDRDRCEICPPLFTLTLRQGRQTFITHKSCSRRHISDAVSDALRQTGISTDSFSGISARKGGLSTAIEACVPEWVLFMQSGHGQHKAARTYVALDSPAFLFDTWAAFNL